MGGYTSLSVLVNAINGVQEACRASACHRLCRTHSNCLSTSSTAAEFCFHGFELTNEVILLHLEGADLHCSHLIPSD